MTADRHASGRTRGFATAATQLQLVVVRLRDRAAVHETINDPTGFHGAAAAAIAEVAGRVDAMTDALLAELDGEPDEHAHA